MANVDGATAPVTERPAGPLATRERDAKGHVLPKGAVPAVKKKAADVLDRSRHYCVDYCATGAPETPFWQDGKPYGHDFKRMHVTDEEVQKEFDQREAQKRKEALKKAKAAVVALERGEEPEPDEKSLDGVNLTQWACGQADYRFALVRMAIEQRFKRSVTDEAAAVSFLIEQHIVDVARARRFAPIASLE